jgi:hypothetical protein
MFHLPNPPFFKINSVKCIVRTVKVPMQYSLSYSYLDPTTSSEFFDRKPSVYIHRFFFFWLAGLIFISSQKCKLVLNFISLYS